MTSDFTRFPFGVLAGSQKQKTLAPTSTRKVTNGYWRAALSGQVRAFQSQSGYELNGLCTKIKFVFGTLSDEHGCGFISYTKRFLTRQG